MRIIIAKIYDVVLYETTLGELKHQSKVTALTILQILCTYL